MDIVEAEYIKHIARCRLNNRRELAWVREDLDAIDAAVQTGDMRTVESRVRMLRVSLSCLDCLNQDSPRVSDPTETHINALAIPAYNPAETSHV